MLATSGKRFIYPPCRSTYLVKSLYLFIVMKNSLVLTLVLYHYFISFLIQLFILSGVNHCLVFQLVLFSKNPWLSALTSATVTWNALQFSFPCTQTGQRVYRFHYFLDPALLTPSILLLQSVKICSLGFCPTVVLCLLYIPLLCWVPCILDLISWFTSLFCWIISSSNFWMKDTWDLDRTCISEKLWFYHHFDLLFGWI